MVMIVAFLLLFHYGFAFDLPKENCRSDLKIKDDHYNVNNTYSMGNASDAYPSDAHFDMFGNLFYVESGRKEDGFYFDVKVIHSKTDTSHKINGKYFSLIS